MVIDSKVAQVLREPEEDIYVRVLAFRLYSNLGILIHLMDILPNDPVRLGQLTATPFSASRL
jgi:hypothetical protein